LLDSVSGEPRVSSPNIVALTPTVIEPIEPPTMLLGFESTNIVSSDDPLGLSSEVDDRHRSQRAFDASEGLQPRREYVADAGFAAVVIPGSGSSRSPIS
jgi:hypothetical protein